MIEQDHIEENKEVNENNQVDAFMNEQVTVEETEVKISQENVKENISVEENIFQEENITHEENITSTENSKIYETGPGKFRIIFLSIIITLFLGSLHIEN